MNKVGRRFNCSKLRLVCIFTIFICLMQCFFPVNIYADNSNSESIELDPFLRQAILSNMGKPLDNTEPLSIGKLQSLTGRIAISEVLLENISGIEYLTGIDELSIYLTKIEDVSAISNLENLKHLSLTGNQIRQLPSFKKLTNLESLLAESNHISDISEIVYSTKLEYIFLGNNQITKLPALTGLTNLIQMELNNNKISIIEPMSGLPFFQELNLDNNSLTDISPLTGLTSLKTISVRCNNITSLNDKDVFPNLERIYLCGNSLTDYNLSVQFPTLLYLGMTNCGLTDISSLLAHPTIEGMHLFDNEISDISVLTDVKNTRLNLLDLSNNNIIDLSPLMGYDFLFPIYLEGNPIDYTDSNNIKILERLFEKYPEVKFEINNSSKLSSSIASDFSDTDQKSFESFSSNVKSSGRNKDVFIVVGLFILVLSIVVTFVWIRKRHA